MIPSVILRQHLLQAVQQARCQGIPPGRSCRDYCLVYDSSHYPPKYIIALAHEAAVGHLLPSDEFSGGKEANNFLQSRGFKVVQCGCGGVRVPTKHVTHNLAVSNFGTGARQLHTHSHRCRECKNRVRQLLEHVYGECQQDYRFPWPAHLPAYRDTPVFSTLQMVLRSLEAFRDHTNFVKTVSIPPCDFFVPGPGFIVEFDESQHFTVPRKIALSLYPPDCGVGFSVDRWVALCEKHNAKDNDPSYRDEQRAWYDTLRDLVPPLHGPQCTVRLYAADMQWCALDPRNRKDVETFQEFLLKDAVVEHQASIQITAERPSRNHERLSTRHLSSAVATVLTEEWGTITSSAKDSLVKDVVTGVVNRTQEPVVIVLPAGFYSHTALAKLFHRTGGKVASMLKAADPDGRVCVCLGLDGLNGQGQAADQLVAAISHRGPEAAGKKFYPTKNEKEFVNLGSPNRGELGLGRVLRWPIQKGSTFYLAACYDGYGIANGAIGARKPTDAIAELIHGFNPIGGGNSGVGYYPRGLARASQNWNCPVFSGAAFRNRYLSPDFPSGLWVHSWTKGWNAWGYQDNKMPPPNYQFQLRQSSHLGALVQIWHAGQTLSSH